MQRFRFSLRTLLILLTLTAMWLGYNVWRAERSERAITAIQQVGGVVTFDISEGAPHWLVELVGDKYFKRVTSVNLHRITAATDEHVQLLVRFPHIESLTLNRTRVTDAGMKHLASLSKLKFLELEGVDISDEGVAQLGQLNKLMVLKLTGTRVSIDGLASVAPLAATLNELWIARTQIDDEQAKAIKQNWPTTTIVYGRGNTLQ